MMNLVELHEVAVQAAKQAEAEFMTQYGEPAYCGFAWVTIFADGRNPQVKEMVKKGYASKSWDGRGYVVWNPSNNGTQSMDVKETGARAYAKVLQDAGFRAYSGSRAD